jgi:hypothetical protein
MVIAQAWVNHCECSRRRDSSQTSLVYGQPNLNAPKTAHTQTSTASTSHHLFSQSRIPRLSKQLALRGIPSIAFPGLQKNTNRKSLIAKNIKSYRINQTQPSHLPQGFGTYPITITPCKHTVPPPQTRKCHYHSKLLYVNTNQQIMALLMEPLATFT